MYATKYGNEMKGPQLATQITTQLPGGALLTTGDITHVPGVPNHFPTASAKEHIESRVFRPWSVVSSMDSLDFQNNKRKQMDS